MDADDEDDFISKLASLKDIWNSKEQEFLAIEGAPKFYKYIMERVSITLARNVNQKCPNSRGTLLAKFYKRVGLSCKTSICDLKNCLNCMKYAVCIIIKMVEVGSPFFIHPVYP